VITEPELLDIYRDTVQPLYAFAFHRSGGRQDLAEDTVQETYTRAVSEWRRKGLPRVPIAWLKTVARNLLISQYRRTTPESLGAVVIDLEDNDWNPEREEEVALLYCGLARLKAEQSELLESFYLDGMSTREIAAARGLSERAIEGRLRRARLKLGKQLRRIMPRGGNEQ
jgi:RNA polymerase sigma-70 factor (ECF subfamily)